MLKQENKVESKEELSGITATANYEKLMSAIEKNNNKNDDVLYKDVSKITENEVKNARKHALFETADKQLAERLNQKVEQWYDTMYSREPQELDASGRPIEPEKLFEVADEVSEPVTKDNLAFDEGFRNIARNAADKDVVSLQRGLNKFDYNPKLKEDDILGPKTTSRIKDALYDYGSEEVNSKTDEAYNAEALSKEKEDEESVEDKKDVEIEKEAPTSPKDEEDEEEDVGGKKMII